MIESAGNHSRSLPLTELLNLGDALGSEIQINGLALDSRAIEPGDLFLAVPGETHDGRQFIEQAVASGAAAVLAEAPIAGFVDELSVPLIEWPDLRFELGTIAARFFRHPSRDMHVLGVTGTNGKTTTTRLFAQLGRSLGMSCGVIGTLGATIDESVNSSRNTTPDPVMLQRQLDEWRADEISTVAMEVSSHALVQGRVAGVEFDTAVYTNLSHDHLDYHGTMERYLGAKLQLFATAGLRHALVNADDQYSALVLAAIPSDINVWTFSAMDKTADIKIEMVDVDTVGMSGRLSTPWGGGSFSSSLLGRFNLSNLAAAVAAIVLAGENIADALAVIPQLQAVPGRMQSIPNDLGIQVIIDYAHTPDALEQVLAALQPQVKGSLVTVFGCGGDRDRAKRSMMGAVASSLSTSVIVTSDNPRNENADTIMADIAVGCSGVYQLIADRAEAIFTAIDQAEAGDCIVIAGKGHEDYQIVGPQRLHFSDEEQASEALLRRLAR
ncbi:MAG: UDP-N-acetylmuramoyl-L-alanyl-D-glutamate--2,6-diaminopimelate ligase [Pseudomonadota bacterium]